MCPGDENDLDTWGASGSVQDVDRKPNLTGLVSELRRQGSAKEDVSSVVKGSRWTTCGFFEHSERPRKGMVSSVLPEGSVVTLKESHVHRRTLKGYKKRTLMGYTEEGLKIGPSRRVPGTEGRRGVEHRGWKNPFSFG